MAEPVNMTINDGGAMYAHEMSANFSATQVFFDFKMITPRVDPRGKGRPTFLMQHNVVMVDPWHAKKIIEVLEATVKKYEEEYGKIVKPKALIKAEKKQKDLLATQGEETKETPTYLG
ncbi:DUF3467 domain-containing protein [Candidatus Woesearchaeota archaeon]|nr:DUF3467 domain-containing protein [Candidatus Woesearchaeota archaeon]